MDGYITIKGLSENIMFDIYDVHCHILYGIDDGSKNIEQSMSMIGIAHDEGIRGIILTPHYNRRYANRCGERVQERYDALKKMVAEKYPDMKLYLGSELYYTENTVERLNNGEIYTMAGSKYVLVEFAEYVDFPKINHAVTTLIQHGYRPIVAHVERYGCSLEKPEYIETLAEMGAVIQVNAGSIIGKTGLRAKRVARKLLKEGIVDLVATDAHSDSSRAPHITKAADYIRKRCGEEYAKEVLHDNPLCIIEDKFMK